VPAEPASVCVKDSSDKRSAVLAVLSNSAAAWSTCVEDASDKRSAVLAVLSKLVADAWSACVEDASDKRSAVLAVLSEPVAAWSACVEEASDRRSAVLLSKLVAAAWSACVEDASDRQSPVLAVLTACSTSVDSVLAVLDSLQAVLSKREVSSDSGSDMIVLVHLSILDICDAIVLLATLLVGVLSKLEHATACAHLRTHSRNSLSHMTSVHW
jgi:hypothetical protein